ncbi:MAG: serine/threonine-protein phosphatase [Deltaproteobacteria bacterium]|nr:serine/threonine-protein phosphatase [Deltaproteobacteria bacterium]
MTTAPPGFLHAVAAGTTDVGRHREHNEDCYLVRAELGLWVVADGMGGHNAGEVASALVTVSVGNFFEATGDGTWDELYARPSDEPLPPAARRLAAAIRKANLDVHTLSLGRPEHRGMGSTIVAAHLPPGTRELHVGHVGDSRCYRIRGGRIELLTRDHSLLNEAKALDPPLSDADLARVPPNIITRALGMDASVDVDVRTFDVEAGDGYLLCSDGLSSMLDEAQMLEAVLLLQGSPEASDLLVALANEAGGLDNVTAVLVQVAQ